MTTDIRRRWGIAFGSKGALHMVDGCNSWYYRCMDSDRNFKQVIFTLTHDQLLKISTAFSTL
jgi:hypothetical protein